MKKAKHAVHCVYMVNCMLGFFYAFKGHISSGSFYSFVIYTNQTTDDALKPVTSNYSAEMETGKVENLNARHPNLQLQHFYDNNITVIIPAPPLVEQEILRIEDLLNESLIGYSGNIPLG